MKPQVEKAYNTLIELMDKWKDRLPLAYQIKAIQALYVIKEFEEIHDESKEDAFLTDATLKYRFVKCNDRMPTFPTNYFTKRLSYNGYVYNGTTSFNGRLWDVGDTVVEWLEEYV